MEGILIFYLGLNFLKGTLVEDGGKIVLNEQRELTLIRNEEYVEQEPEQWYTAITDIIGAIQSSDSDIKIKSITITYQPGTFVCVDRYGRALMNAILPCDRRAKYQIHLCEKIIKRHGNGYFIPWKFMTLPRLLWIKYNKGDIYKKIFKVLTPDGYIAYRMSGESAIDNYSALFMGYNVEDNSYDSKLTDALELDNGIYPTVCKTGDCIGIIAGETRQELGLKDDVNILMTSSSLLPLAEIVGSINSGIPVYDIESSFICFPSKDGMIKADKEILKIHYKDNYLYFISSNYEIHFIEWIEKLLCHPVSDCNNFTPGSNGLVVLPYLMGDSRLHGSDIKGGIIGIGENTACDIITASYEAVGFILKERLEHLSECGLHTEELEILHQMKGKMFPHIISDITSKKIFDNRLNDVYTSAIYKIINGFGELENSHREVFTPCEEDCLKYNQLNNLFWNTLDSLSGIYRYRRKVLRKINS